MGFHLRSFSRLSLRARWFWAGALFYAAVVGLLVVPELREDRESMERAFRNQLRGAAELATGELAREGPAMTGPEVAAHLRRLLLDYPGFDYAILEERGRTLWTMLSDSARERTRAGTWSVPAAGGPPGGVIAAGTVPGGWLGLSGHLLETSAPVGGAGSGLVLRLGMDTGAVDRTIAIHLWIAGAVIAFTSLLGIGLAAGMDRSIRKKVQELITAADTVAQGLPHRVQIRSGDELEVLGHTFNTMAERLREREQELQAVQQTLRSIFDCIHSGITYVSRDHRILMVNAFQEGMFGKDRAEFLGHHCYEEFEKRGQVCPHCPGTLSMADGEVHSAETEAVLDDGRRVSVLINAYPVKDASGEVLGFVEHVEDVTRWKQMEEALKNHSQDLEGMVQARTRELLDTQAQLLRSAKLASLGEMVGGVAHEINNPIAIMSARLEVLMSEMRDEISPGLARDLEVLLKHAKRISGITSKLLAFSRMSSPHKKTSPLYPVIEEAAGLVESQFHRRGITIERSLDHDLPEAVIDSGQMLQVFLNLLNNAADAMGGEGKIRISGRTGRGQGREWIELAFEDTGPGVPVEIRDKIFDPFFTTKEVGAGTGLGLSVSYGIVTDHGGEIFVGEGEGGGATFVVRLPAAEPAARETEEVA